MESRRRSIGLQSLGNIIDEHLRLHSDGASQVSHFTPLLPPGPLKQLFSCVGGKSFASVCDDCSTQDLA